MESFALRTIWLPWTSSSGTGNQFLYSKSRVHIGLVLGGVSGWIGGVLLSYLSCSVGVQQHPTELRLGRPTGIWALWEDYDVNGITEELKGRGELRAASQRTGSDYSQNLCMARTGSFGVSEERPQEKSSYCSRDWRFGSPGSGQRRVLVTDGSSL